MITAKIMNSWDDSASSRIKLLKAKKTVIQVKLLQHLSIIYSMEQNLDDFQHQTASWNIYSGAE